MPVSHNGLNASQHNFTLTLPTKVSTSVRLNKIIEQYFAYNVRADNKF